MSSSKTIPFRRVAMSFRSPSYRIHPLALLQAAQPSFCICPKGYGPCTRIRLPVRRAITICFSRPGFRSEPCILQTGAPEYDLERVTTSKCLYMMLGCRIQGKGVHLNTKKLANTREREHLTVCVYIRNEAFASQRSRRTVTGHSSVGSSDGL